ncbi:MAG TPA: hypothetical protein PLS49_09720 [Candidatus Woesebacteria bacterium]|nr:hypothetical protein [Candidatus Woesebacteria bacterium]
MAKIEAKIYATNEGYIKVIKRGSVTSGEWVDKNEISKDELQQVQKVR